MPKFISKNKKQKNKKAETNSKSQKVFSKLKWLDPFTYVDLYVMPKVKAKTQSKPVEHLVNIFFAGLFAIIVYVLLGLLFGTGSPLVIVYSASMEPEFFRGDVMALTATNQTMNFGKEITLNQNVKNVPVENFLTAKYTYGGEAIELIGISDSKYVIKFLDGEEMLVPITKVNLEKIIFENGEEIIPEKDASIIVYPAFPAGIPIIHRAIAKINANDGVFFLTKGDNDLTNPTFDQDCGKIDTLRNLSTKPCITFYAIPIENVQGVAFGKIPLVGCVKLWLFDDLFSLISTGKLPNDFRGIC